jgi:hypothetical protein
MDQVIDALSSFFHHLSAVNWSAMGLAAGCHVARLALRTLAWRNIIRAAYPDAEVPRRTVLGAYFAGVGVNAITPARGGDLLKLYLTKRRVQGATYPTLGATLVVETLFDFVVALAMLAWTLSAGVLPSVGWVSMRPACTGPTGRNDEGGKNRSPVSSSPVASAHAATNAAWSCATAGPSKRAFVSRHWSSWCPSPSQ